MLHLRDLLSEASEPGLRRAPVVTPVVTPAVTPAPSPQTGRRSVCEDFHLSAETQGRPRLLSGRWPCDTGLASYLSSCLSFTGGRCCFQLCPRREFARGAAGSFPPDHRCDPVSRCPLFAFRLRSGTLRQPPHMISRECRKHRYTLAHSSNCRPFPGHCVSSPGRNPTGRT